MMYFIRLIILLALVTGFFHGNAGEWLLKADGRCRIWWAGSTYKIMRESAVPEKNGKVVLRSAKNEAESFQLVLTPLGKLEDICVTVSDFRGKDGALIASENTVVRQVEYVHITKPSGELHQAGWYPDPLPLYEKPFSADAGQNTPVWFTVKVPRDAAAGKYTARISLESAGWQATVPVELDVWDFTLPDVPFMRSAFGLSAGNISRYHNLDNQEELKQVLDRYYQSFRDHRISPQFFYDRYPIKKEVKGIWWNGGTFDPDTVFEGKYAYQVTGAGSGTHAGLIKIDPGKPYRVTWQAKTLREGQEYVVTVQSYTCDQKPITGGAQGLFYPGSTQWKKDSLFLDPSGPFIYDGLVVYRPIPKNAAYVRVQLYADRGKAGVTWFDDLRFTDVQKGTNLLPHGSFEQDSGELDVRMDFSAFDEGARKYLDGFGFTGFRVKAEGLSSGPYYGPKTGWFNGFINGTEEYDKLMRRYLGQFQDHLEANGWLGKEYLYWKDEPKHEEYELVREGMNTIRRVAPKLTRLITENNPGPGIMDVTEIGCPVFCKVNPPLIKEWAPKGRRFWSYLMCWPKAPHLNLFIDSEAIDLRMWLWMSYRYHLTGILVWTSSEWDSNDCLPEGELQNIWEDPMTYRPGCSYGGAIEFGNGDGMFFYPPNRDPNHDQTKYLTGPVPSQRLEILREGLDDYDYLVMLENGVKEAGPGQKRWAERARKILGFGTEVFVDDTRYAKDPEVLISYREQAGKLLEEFYRNKN